jgi:hypothetical protein
MTRFLDLMYGGHVEHPDDEEWDADAHFPASVADSLFRLFNLGDPIPQQGTFILLGVATWSDYNMHLLDMLEEAMGRPGDHPAVAVFNAGNLTSMEAIRKYIPDCPEMFHPPALGLWRDGVLTERAEGYRACDAVARLFGFTAEDVINATDQSRAARAGSLPHAS